MVAADEGRPGRLRAERLGDQPDAQPGMAAICRRADAGRLRRPPRLGDGPGQAQVAERDAASELEQGQPVES
jgi:hypothetical protein